MEGKTFQEFVDFVFENWGYRVYKTSPETAIIVGSFFEQPMGYTIKKDNTKVYKLGDGKWRCNNCGIVFHPTKDIVKCPACSKVIDEIILLSNTKHKEEEE